MRPSSKAMKFAWRTQNPDQSAADSDAQFWAWYRSEKADAWALGADRQARQDGSLPDWVWNPYNRDEAVES